MTFHSAHPQEKVGFFLKMEKETGKVGRGGCRGARQVGACSVLHPPHRPCVWWADSCGPGFKGGGDFAVGKVWVPSEDGYGVSKTFYLV